MYLLLLVFGLVLAAAGLLFGASGISIHDRAFDASLLTPGIVALVGGLILVGLGLVLRVLQRIEHALALQPMPRASGRGETGVSLAGFAPLAEPHGIHLPPQSEIRPQAGADSASALSAEPSRSIDPARLKFPTLSAVETAAAGAEAAAATVPRNDAPPARAEPRLPDATSEPAAERPVAHRNGGGMPKTAAPRIDPAARPTPPNERAKSPGFDTFWPKGQRPLRAAEPPPAGSAAPMQQNNTPAAAPGAVSVEEARPEPVSVLKSGVVDGMAYTLFSDGSIEAQLPQGTLRFGSITELRHHIEQTPADAAAS